MSYIAPEAIEGRRPLDLRADVFSLGCTAFHRLTGTVPCTCISVALTSTHLNRPILRITERAPTPGTPESGSRRPGATSLSPNAITGPDRATRAAAKRGQTSAATSSAQPQLRVTPAPPWP